MLHYRSTACLALLLSLGLPLTSDATLPMQMPPGGFLHLLKAKPFQAIVKERLITLDGVKIVLTDENGNMATYEINGVDAHARKVVMSLEAGKTYEFPKAIEQALGADFKKILAALPDLMPVAPPTAPNGLMALRGLPPFLATVTAKTTLANVFSLKLLSVDGTEHSFAGTTTPEIDAVLSLLEQDHLHEFPDIIEQALLPTNERRAAIKIASDYEPLGAYIGEWEGALNEAPQIITQMRCLWRADGRGMWRVLITQDKDKTQPPFIEVAFIDYDSARGAFRTTVPSDPERAPLFAKWNAKARTFTSVLNMEEQGMTKVNVAAFTNDNRIDWKTTTTSARESGVSSGYYSKLR